MSNTKDRNCEEVFDVEEMLRELIEHVKELTEQLAELQRIIAVKDAEIATLTAKIEEQSHKKNSGNSSKPPSNERLEKPAPRSLRGKSGKKTGGQVGHKGSGMKIDRKPDEVIPYYPSECTGCPHMVECKYKSCGTRYEYEVIVKTKLIAHQVMCCRNCQRSGKRVEGKFPVHITGAKQYGPGVAALSNSLLTVGYMSIDRDQQLLRSLGIPISQGTIQEMLAKAAAGVEDTVGQIRQRIEQLQVAHFDETGLRVAGKLHWLHCACSEKLCYYSVQEKRGTEAMDAIGILPNFHGVAVTDFWKPYQKYDNILHAMCCQHLERELVYAEETGKQPWAKLLRELLQTMCHRRKLLQAEGYEAFPESEIAQYLQQYDTLVSQGIEANPVPDRKPGQRGRQGKGKIRCLLERFKDFKADILRFAHYWQVPFTNNTAEQAIRFARVKEKVSGCFRTKTGADQFACVLSFISTAALHGVSSFDAFVSVALGNAVSVIPWE